MCRAATDRGNFRETAAGRTKPRATTADESGAEDLVGTEAYAVWAANEQSHRERLVLLMPRSNAPPSQSRRPIRDDCFVVF